MAQFSPSRNDIAPVCVEDEGLVYSGALGVSYPLMSGNYGVDPTLVLADDGIWTVNSENPFQLDLGTHEINVHNSTLSRTKDLLGVRLWRINFTFPMMGGTGAAIALRWIDVATAGGLDYDAAVVGTPNGVIMTPSSLQKQRSSTMACEYDGATHKSSGVVGGFTISSRVGEGLLYTFDGLGLYQAPVLGTLGTVYTGETWGAGNDNAAAFLGAGATIRRSVSATGSATSRTYAATVLSFNFQYNATIGRIKSANATDGLQMLLAVNRNPRLDIVFNMDVDSASQLTYPQIYSDTMSSYAYDISFTHTDLGSRTFTFNFPNAQCTRPSVASGGEGVREITMSCKLAKVAAGGNDEFYIQQT